MGQLREGLSARPSGNDQAGEESPDGLIREDSARRRTNDSAPGAGAGGSQFLPPGATGGFAARAGSLAGTIEYGRPCWISQLSNGRGYSCRTDLQQTKMAVGWSLRCGGFV